MSPQSKTYANPQTTSSPATDQNGHTRPFTIVVPLDGSERAAEALPIAEDLCHQLSGALALVRISPACTPPYAIGAGYLTPELYAQQLYDEERWARLDLERAAAHVQEQGIPAQIHLELGDPAAAIIDVAATLDASLVVLTTHGCMGQARFVIGSVADRVVRGCAAPTLLLRSFPPGPSRPAGTANAHALGHALIPLDGSVVAESALFTIARQLAGRVLHEITLIRIVDSRDGETAMKAAQTYLSHVRRRFREVLGDSDCAVSTHTQVGAPAASILALARERAIDLILLSTHGEAGRGRAAFGTVTERLLRDGETPLPLARPAQTALSH
jgi:nucleotide-binding universal stress UspA family protein